MNNKKPRKVLKVIGRVIKQLLFYEEIECSVCARQGQRVCDECSEMFLRHDNIICNKCGREIKEAGLCYNCRKNNRPYEKGIIALYYQDIPREFMKEFKYNSKRNFSYFFAEEIYNKIKSCNWDIDVICAVPMHNLKLLGNGYNPPSLISRELSILMDIPYSRKTLKRKRYTRSMSLLKNIDRMEHSSKNFMTGNFDYADMNVLVVDDVSTTGATLHVCSKILLDNGANKVYVVAACGDNTEF